MFINVFPFYCFIILFYLISLLDSIPLRLPIKQYIYVKKLAFFILVLFAGCRWTSWRVGYEADIFDYDTYKTIFEYPISFTNFISDYTNASSAIKQIELGYVCYSAFMHLILGNNYNLYLLFTNLFLVILLYRGFKVNKISYGLFFVIYFYAARLYLQYNFILIRQAIAIVIVWYAFHYIMQNRIKKYCFFVLLASMFHFTAIVGFFVPLLLKIKINKKIYFTLLLCVFIVNVAKLSNNIVLEFINFILSFFDINGSDRLLKYLLFGEESIQGLNLLTFVESVPFVYIAVRYEYKLLETIEGRFYYNMLFIFLFLLVLTMNFSFLTRMWQYFLYSYFYLISFYAATSSIKNQRLLFSLFGLYLLIYSYRYIMIWFSATPYSFFLLHEAL